MRRMPRVNAAYLTPTSALKKTCPQCGAAPGWKCIRYAYDADGNPYEQSRLKHPHAARRTPR